MIDGTSQVQFANLLLSARALTQQASTEIYCYGLCWKDIARVTYRVAISQASPI
jgi:hypothetical protein